MAGNLSDYTKNMLRTGFFRTGAFVKPAGLYKAFFTAAPTDAGGGTEVVGGSYGRVQVGPLDAVWSAHATPGRTQNVSAVTFPAPTANWGTATHSAYFDAAVAGNMLWWNQLATARVVNNGDPAPVFAPGTIDFTWGGNLSDYTKNMLRTGFFRTGAFVKPAGIWEALFTAAPTDAGGGTEIVGGSYGRVQVGPLDAAWSAHATAGRTQNVSPVTYPAPTANWLTATHSVFFDAAVAGNMLAWKPLATARLINIFDPAPVFAATALDFQWD